MTRSTPFPIVGCVVAAIMLAYVATAQAGVNPKFFLDDFEDMDIQDGTPVSWSDFSGEDLDASSGDLTLTCVDVSGFALVDDYTYDDVSIRTQFRVMGEPFLDTGVFARYTPGSAYIASVSSEDWWRAPSSLVIYGWLPDLEILQQAPTSLDPTQTDVMLQFDVIGHVLTLTAWADGMPKQSISVEDNRAQQGQIGIAHDDGIGWHFPAQDPTPATYRFFEVVPEPSTFALTALAFLAVVCRVRRTRRA